MWKLIRVGLKEHENHDAGDRNVKPNGKCEARDAAVHGEAAGEREKECGEDHGQRDDGKNDVAGQNAEIKRADRAVAGKNCVTVQSVVHDVADQKSGRERESYEHAIAMRFLVPMFDEIKSHAKRDGAQSVQERVQGRKEHPSPGKIGRGVMHVEQPQQEGHGKAADHDDCAHDGARTNFSAFHTGY
jgi:hypothetical protein